MLITRVGKIELRVPRDRNGEFSTALFERFQRSEKALVSALAEMYIQGVSTRKVKAITEELCGHSFSASAISAINKGLDESLTKFARRKLTEDYPYLILDARYEKVREDGVIQSQALLVAIGINWEGKRQILGVELANRESQTSWREFRWRAQRLTVVGSERGRMESASVQRVRHSRKLICAQSTTMLASCAILQQQSRRRHSWLGRWQKKYPKLTDWAEAHIGSTLTFYRLPRLHHRHLKSTNMLERLNEELRRRTRVVRIFPNAASCLRLTRALCAETHEAWLEDNRYINMDLLREQRKEQLRKAA